MMKSGKSFWLLIRNVSTLLEPLLIIVIQECVKYFLKTANSLEAYSTEMYVESFNVLIREWSFILKQQLEDYCASMQNIFRPSLMVLFLHMIRRSV